MDKSASTDALLAYARKHGIRFDSAMAPEDFSAPLGCRLLSVSVDVTTRTAHLWLPDGECTDMLGAITYVLQRFPFVAYIRTWSGMHEDTSYIMEDGQWHAWRLMPAPPRTP